MKNWTYNPDLGCYVVEGDTTHENCDGDGANGQTGGIACYVPNGSGLPELDYLANAGHPGDFWGILTDNGEPSGNPVLQDETQPVPGAYISTTSYQFQDQPLRSVNRYLDAAAVPFIVVPSQFQRGVPGIVLGCYCEMQVGDHTESGIVGDIGPAFFEASLAMCRKFDSACTPKHCNIVGVTLRIWPGRAVDGYPLQRA